MAFVKRTLYGSPSLQGFDPSTTTTMELYEPGGSTTSETLGFPLLLMEPTSNSLSTSCLSFAAYNNNYHYSSSTDEAHVEPVLSFLSSSSSNKFFSSSPSIFNFEHGVTHGVHHDHHLNNSVDDEFDGWINDAMDQNCSSSSPVKDQLQGSFHHMESSLERSPPQKRPMNSEAQSAANMQQSTSPDAKKAKRSSPTSSKDPQSIAAKNRRERISERLKILQELVPNGTKVDLVTMLEKAITYVKFLQLQVKVLATDEFWPANGGKAPEIGQVKESIDSILSSYRQNSS